LSLPADVTSGLDPVVEDYSGRLAKVTWPDEMGIKVCVLVRPASERRSVKPMMLRCV
jgi:hypothetical protein